MKHRTYCTFPFDSIAPKSWYKGKPHRITPCCNMKTNDDDPMGVSELISEGKSLKDIFLSEQFDNLRSDILNGIKNEACNYCWNLEDKTGHSPRITAIEAIEKPIDTKLTRIDSMLDENCNLRCRMCSPSVSNSLRQDYNKILELGLPLPEYYNIKEEESKDDTNGTQTFFGIGEQYVNEIIELSDEITELKFTGGEPTTSKIFWDIVDNINPENIKLHLTTNGTKFNNRLFETINKFNKTHFTISVDATRSTYEYIRYPFSWRKLEKNIEDLCENTDPEKLEIHVCSVLTIYNMINIRNLVDWVHQHNWFAEHKITWKCIPDPHPYESCLDVKWASQELLETAWMNMSVALEDANSYTRPALQKTCAYLRDCIDAEMDEEMVLKKRAKLKLDTLTLDKVREQDYTEMLYPQIADFISDIQMKDQ